MLLRWALGFFIVALLAALLGFGGIALRLALPRLSFFFF